jgi:predicted Rossmann fold nucleotide-binding protein DprA/Smf involved in DNA uptake
LAEAGITIARVPGPRRKSTALPKPKRAQAVSLAKTQRLLDLLEDGPGLTGELAVELGISPSWASNQLNDLAEQGKVEKVPFLGLNLCPTVLWCLKADAHE